MLWKDKINQLTALLEKMPQSQSYDTDKGVYQPYFILEFRPSNWEVIPYAEYTRLDGISGKDAKLTLQLIESQKVNINQEELNLLVYIYSFTHQDSRRLFRKRVGTVCCVDDCMDSSPDKEIPFDFHEFRVERLDKVVQHPVDHVLMERAFIPE